MFSAYTLENVRLKEIVPQAEQYNLVNNYGWHWGTFDLRHMLNIYGYQVDYWSLTDNSKTGTPDCSKNFKTFDEAIKYIKEML